MGQVKQEPVVSEDGNDGALVTDLGVCGVWSPRSEALFDIHVTDSDSQSYLGHAPESILFQVETETKEKYGAAASACRTHTHTHAHTHKHTHTYILNRSHMHAHAYACTQLIN